MTDRYRVWCLSWDDEEEIGSDVVAYVSHQQFTLTLA